MINNEVLTYLTEKRLLTLEILQDIENQAKESGKSAESVLLEKKIISEEELAKAKAVVYGLEYVNLADKKLDVEILNLIPMETSRSYEMIAFERDDNLVSVALVNPRNFKAVEAMEFLAKNNKLKVKYFVASKSGFEVAHRNYHELGEEVGEVLTLAEEKYKKEAEEEEEELSGANLEKVIKSAPVSTIVTSIIKYSTQGGASDIHIEPSAEGSRVRFRIDGVLRTVLVLPASVHPAVVARIKVLANMKLDETRRPQDGRIKFTVGKKQIDLRVSIIPLVGTEKVVMRVLDTSGVVLKLEQLGFREKHVKLIKESISKTHGEILVTGPTGSGKSTTLYSVLNMLNSEDVNISTLEDPAEYFIRGINQSQVNPDVGFTFASGLRALLRQDPDVIMVGEIRDTETAELAVHAALTGHIVFSTLHTNSAEGAIPRLIDMKVEPFLLAATMECIIAQRLVRKICAECKEEISVPKNITDEVFSSLESVKDESLGPVMAKPKFYRGKGCNKCGNSGYKGRTVIAEVILMNQKIKNMVASGFSFEKLHQLLKEGNHLTIQQDGFLKALEGQTTVEEVLRVMKA